LYFNYYSQKINKQFIVWFNPCEEKCLKKTSNQLPLSLSLSLFLFISQQRPQMLFFPWKEQIDSCHYFLTWRTPLSKSQTRLKKYTFQQLLGKTSVSLPRFTLANFFRVTFRNDLFSSTREILRSKSKKKVGLMWMAVGDNKNNDKLKKCFFLYILSFFLKLQKNLSFLSMSHIHGPLGQNVDERNFFLLKYTIWWFVPCLVFRFFKYFLTISNFKYRV